VRQLSNRLKKLEAAFPAVSADPLGDALEFASRSLAREDVERAIDVALRRASDADLRFLVDRSAAIDREVPGHRSAMHRLGQMVRAAVTEIGAAGFVRATDEGTA
jgi:hypothetical protein